MSHNTSQVLQAENLLPVLCVVRDIKRDHPLLPVILITEHNSANLRHLSSVFVEAVLFQHQIVARLPVALKKSVGTTVGLRALAEACVRNEVIPPPVRHLLTCALSTAPPPRMVQYLARLVNSHPSTIRRHWRRGVNPHGIQRVKDLVDWIVLLHAISAKRPGLSWRCVARGIGTYESTLRRLADRCAGDTLGSLGSGGAERLRERFAKALGGSFCAKLH